MMCHDRRECTTCHKAEGVKDRTNRLYVFNPVVPREETGTSLFIDPNQPVSVGQCGACHNNLDAFKSKKVIFNHSVHVRRGFQCYFCHDSFPHSQAGTKTPPMEACYPCHDQLHGERGVIATGDCYACHPRDFNLVPSSHDPPDWGKNHKALARANIWSCLMCHKPKFCSDCHMAKKAVPKDHKEEQRWMQNHGAEDLQKKQDCSICHERNSTSPKNCKGCHKVEMPHPPGFLTAHRKLGKEPQKYNCYGCHATQFCGKCHHAGISNALLVAKTCNRCHPNADMAWRDLMPIGDKGMVVHSVHFKKKFRCEECHPTVEAKRDAAHNFELCYECHGALDINKTLIAPYPGQELCLRCHNKAI